MSSNVASKGSPSLSLINLERSFSISYPALHGLPSLKHVISLSSLPSILAVIPHTKNDFKFLKLSEDKDIGTYSGVTFYLKFGIASAHCTDYSKEMPYIDNLRINLKTQEYEDWLWIKDPY